MNPSDPEGTLLVDKPAGLASFRVVEFVRRLLLQTGVARPIRVGHGGTLDPFATGLLPILIGRRATRLASRLLDGDKEYRLTLRFGRETDTGDWCGRVVGSVDAPCPTKETIEAVLDRFVGEVVQEVPAYSALKHRGRPLYWYARRGEAVEKPPLRVRIHNVRLIEVIPPDAVFEVTCGKGAYMRVLGRDIARAAGSAGHLVALRRLRVADFRVEEALRWWRLMEGGAFEVLSRLIPLGVKP